MVKIHLAGVLQKPWRNRNQGKAFPYPPTSNFTGFFPIRYAQGQNDEEAEHRK